MNTSTRDIAIEAFATALAANRTAGDIGAAVDTLITAANVELVRRLLEDEESPLRRKLNDIDATLGEAASACEEIARAASALAAQYGNDRERLREHVLAMTASLGKALQIIEDGLNELDALFDTEPTG